MFRPFGGLASATTTSLTNAPVSKRIEPVPVVAEVDSDYNGSASFMEESLSMGGGAGDTSDSKDSQNLKDDLPKEWFYDEMDMGEIDSLEEPKSPADDEYDYDPRYGNKKRKRRRTSRKPPMPHVSDGPRKGRPPGGGVAGGRGRGRRKTAAKGSSFMVEPPSPSIVEPPSFESAAAAVEYGGNDDSASGDLRSYRKYV